MADWMRGRTPMRRLGELDELVGPFLFLASRRVELRDRHGASRSTAAGAPAAVTRSSPNPGTSGEASSASPSRRTDDPGQAFSAANVAPGAHHAAEDYIAAEIPGVQCLRASSTILVHFAD